MLRSGFSLLHLSAVSSSCKLFELQIPRNDVANLQRATIANGESQLVDEPLKWLWKHYFIVHIFLCCWFKVCVCAGKKSISCCIICVFTRTPLLVGLTRLHAIQLSSYCLIKVIIHFFKCHINVLIVCVCVCVWDNVFQLLNYLCFYPNCKTCVNISSCV